MMREDDDDDWDDDDDGEEDETFGRQLLKAVAIAGVTALVAGLTEWAIAEIKEKISPEEKEDEEEVESKKEKK